MHLTYHCPSCGVIQAEQVDSPADLLDCRQCSQKVAVPSEAIADGRLQQCLVCPSTDLFVRKDFPQRLGVLLVAIGVVGSSIAWYYGQIYWTFGILFATALVDVLLYMLVGDALMCYRCGALYRDVDDMHAHGTFDLETHERYRQMAARMGSTGA